MRSRSGLAVINPSVPLNTSMSSFASGQAALSDRTTGVASNTSPMRRVTTTRTRLGGRSKLSWPDTAGEACIEPEPRGDDAETRCRTCILDILIEAHRGGHAVGREDFVQAPLIFGKLRAVAFRMPQVKNRRG